MRGIFVALAIAGLVGCSSGGSAGGGPSPSPTLTASTGPSSPSPQSFTMRPNATVGGIQKRLQTQIWTGDKANPGPKASVAVWAPVADWAGMNTQATTYPVGESSAQLIAAGVKAMPYSDPNHWTANHVGVDNFFDDGDIARACDGTKITIVKQGQKGTPYLIDVRQPHVALAWKAWYAGYVKAGKQASAVFEDTSDNSTFRAAKPSGPCATVGGDTTVSADDWTAATIANEAAMPVPIVFNGLSSGPAVALFKGPAVGGMQEACFGDWGHLSGGGPYTPSIAEWQANMANEIAAKAAGKLYFCQATVSDAGDTPNALAYRLFMIASLDLDVDVPNAVVSWRFQTASGVPVYPEARLVLTGPLTPDPKQPSDLAVGSAYAREYARCYLDGRPITGRHLNATATRCAVAVNANGRKDAPNPIAGPYTRTLVLTGSDILDGGTLSVNGPPPPGTLPPSSAVIEFE